MERHVNDQNHLVFGGHDVTELADRFGTPLYIYDEALIRQNIQAYRETLRDSYPSGQIYYAAKAFLATAMVRVLAEEGVGIDVVSGGELATALEAGFDPGRIIFNGNNKSIDEMTMALQNRVARFVVDSQTELAVLNELAARMGLTVRILIRVNPGVEAHTHEYVKTGITDCKFGLGAFDGTAYAAVETALNSSALVLTGFHCHIGSQIFDLHAYQATVEAMETFIGEVQKRTGFLPAELDLGGGLGIRYIDGDESMDIQAAVRFISAEVRSAFHRHGWPLPTLLLEPGRSIVGEAGLAVYRVGVVKEVPGARTYIALDGGMSDNPRVALYQSRYEAVVASRVRGGAVRIVTLAGKCCESGDILAWDIPLSDVQPGDYVAVFSAGAYQYSMAGNYNRLSRPAVVFAHKNGVDLVVRRETYADILRLDAIPARLAASLANEWPPVSSGNDQPDPEHEIEEFVARW